MAHHTTWHITHSHLTTSGSTSRKHEKVRVLEWKPGKDHPRPTKSTIISTKNQQRRSWSAETSKKYEFYSENPVKDHPRPTKSTRITTKNEHRRSWSAKKVRELPRETRFRPFQDHRRPPKSTRITTKYEHRRCWRAGNYENSHTTPRPDQRATPETTKIHRQNEHASTKPRK